LRSRRDEQSAIRPIPLRFDVNRGAGSPPLPSESHTDMIFIKGVVIHARHGVMEHETEVGQRFVIDLEMSSDLSESSRTDRLSDTVSYSDVVATATAAFKDDNYQLLERAAGAVADAILDAFDRISAVKVTVHKPHAPIAAIFEDVGVVLTRKR
jgi:dihydroneopterin aldolase